MIFFVKTFYFNLFLQIANVVLEQLYCKSKREDQYELQKELYGGSNILVTSETVTGLDVIFRVLPNMKESTLTNTKANLMGLFEKYVSFLLNWKLLSSLYVRINHFTKKS